MIKLLGQYNSKKDRTRKWVFENEKNEIIELSLISTKTQDIIYVPTHYNCPLGCSICNLKEVCQSEELKPIEFDDLMEAIEETIISGGKRHSNNTKILVSFRGVGEPLLNMPLLEKMYKGKYNLERLGYFKVGFEISTMMPNESLGTLIQYIKKGKYPVRVIYRLASPLDDKCKKLVPISTLSVDTSLSYLKKFKDEIDSNSEIKHMYRNLFGPKSSVEVFYSIIPGINDSPFELANLQYFQSRFDIPVVFLKNKTGEEMWKEDILNNYPEAKISIVRPMGRDIGCEHGEFDTSFYGNQEPICKAESYDSIVEKSDNNKEKAFGKTLKNKVV